MTRITKAVFPVAGLGTRFLPVTKASPKEMLPIVDKPLIQYAAEEAIAAGITELIFVTGRNKRSIEDHFDKAYELENELKSRNKKDLLDIVQNVIPDTVSCVYIRQTEALGLGHAVLCARQLVGDSPFAVILADDLVDSAKKSCLSQMTELHERYGGSILGVQDVPKEQVSQYGIVATEGKPIASRLKQITGIVEKPDQNDAPSTLGVIGRYVLSPAIFDYLENTKKGAGGEIQLTDAIAKMLNREAVYAYEFEGIRYDCGSKLGYLEACVKYGLKHNELSDAFRKFLKGLDLSDN